MTITYTGKVADARLGSFSRLLFYWRGSIYKLMYKEMIIFCGLYATISIIYRFSLRPAHKRVFEQISLYCQSFTDLIPMSFILGFYVSIVVTRWWSQYMKIPWPDRIMMYVTSCLDGADECARLMRRTIVRYLTLGSLLVFQATAVSVKKRFPTMEHLIEAGVITPGENKALDEIRCPHGKWWIPFLWITNMLKDARKQGRISDNFVFKCLLDEVMSYRGCLGELYSYDWISVPLVYTQVTTLAVYIFFLGAVFGRQFLDPEQGYAGHTVDLYFPMFTLLQFFFYMGWLKVAEQLINPFGEDDDDFEMNWIIDRNLQISLLAVDDLHGHYPCLEKDIYFGEPPPEFLPYTKSSISTKIEPHMGSMADLTVSSDGMRTVNPMETIQEGVTFQSGHLSHPPPLRLQSGSPCSTPCKPMGYHPNAIKTPLSMSKLTMDGFGFGSQSGREGRFLVQPVEISLASKAHSTIESWLQRRDDSTATTPREQIPDSPSSHIRSSSREPSICSRTPTRDGESAIFNMEIEDKRHSLMEPTVDVENVNSSMYPDTHLEPRSHSFSAGPTTLTSQPRQPVNNLLQESLPTNYVWHTDSEQAPGKHSENAQTSEDNHDYQEQNGSKRTPHPSSSSNSSSIDYYEKPGTVHGTVNSLTPLLNK